MPHLPFAGEDIGSPKTSSGHVEYIDCNLTVSLSHGQTIPFSALGGFVGFLVFFSIRKRKQC